MAEINVFDKTDLTNHNPAVTDNKVNNWISQINVGGTIHDIATHHKIKFVDGNGGAETEWNGLTDIEIVIPTIKDIVQTPIEFAGTVDATGEVTYNSEHKDGPQTGYLVFITDDCTFEGNACEAGDMAIYDGSEWKVVTGENQVTITGTTNNKITDSNRTTVTIKGTETDVLEVEGKALSLKLDYSDIVSHIDLDKTSGGQENVQNGKVTVGSVNLKLTETPSDNIATGKTINLATALNDGKVTFTTATDKTFVTGITGGEIVTEGTMPTLNKNGEEKTFELGGGLTKSSINKHFVEKVSFNKLEKEEDGAVKLHGDLIPGTGTEFVTSINGSDSFTVSYIKPTEGLNAEFIKYVDGNYVTSVSTGSFKIGDGSYTKVAVGFDTETESGDVVSSLEVNTTKNTSVLNSAYVEEGTHVLCFGSVNVIDTVTATPKYKSLTTKTVSYTPTTVGISSFTSGGFTTDSTNVFTLNKTAETTYTQDKLWYKLTQEKAGYDVSGAYAIVPEGTFGVSLSEGSFPTMSPINCERNGSLAATVDTSLNSTPETLYTFNSNYVTFNKYSLGVVNEGGDVTVGASGTVNVNGATVDLTTYKKDVNVKVK